MPLIIHSKSTKHYAEQLATGFDHAELIDVSTIGKPEPKGDPIVIGVGGGKVIDYAKIMAGDKQAIAYPTTAAGAAATSHAVYWDPVTKRKIDIPTNIPIIKIEASFLEKVSEDPILHATSYDALGHALDSYWSKKATLESKKLSKRAYSIITSQIKKDYDNIVELIHGGNIAGAAIEITGTNMTHAVSYPLTSLYNVPHGIAIGWAIPYCAMYQECDLLLPLLEIKLEGITKDTDFYKKVAEEAMTYNKIHDANKDITEKRLIELLVGKK